MSMSGLNNLLNYSVRIGRLFDVPISLHISLVFFLLPVLQASRFGVPLIILEFIFLVVVSILLHELGHALTAKRYKMGGLSIMLHGFGGFATSTGYRTPKQELIIVLAGPAVTFAIGILCLGSSIFGPQDFSTVGLQFSIIYSIGVLNITMGVLNLLPSLPFDGGRALSAILSFRIGEFKATRIVGHIGLIISSVLAIYGIVTGWGFVTIFGLMGVIASYMHLANTGGIKFGEFIADRYLRKQNDVFRKRNEEKSREYLDDVLSKQKEREERERLRKLFEDSLDDK